MFVLLLFSIYLIQTFEDELSVHAMFLFDLSNTFVSHLFDVLKCCS